MARKRRAKKCPAHQVLQAVSLETDSLSQFRINALSLSAPANPSPEKEGVNPVVFFLRRAVLPCMVLLEMRCLNPDRLGNTVPIKAHTVPQHPKKSITQSPLRFGSFNSISRSKMISRRRGKCDAGVHEIRPMSIFRSRHR